MTLTLELNIPEWADLTTLRVVSVTPRIAGHEEPRLAMLWRDPEGEGKTAGWWVIEVPSLPGCVSCGANSEEAIFMARDAAELLIESHLAHGEPVPPGDWLA